MRHGNSNRILSRTRRGRDALLTGLAVALVERERIETTHAKAKELQPFFERLVTYGKQNTVAAKRKASSKLNAPSDTIVKKLFEEIAPRFMERSGGYTRVIKKGRTKAGTDSAIIELV